MTLSVKVKESGFDSVVGYRSLECYGSIANGWVGQRIGIMRKNSIGCKIRSRTAEEMWMCRKISIAAADITTPRLPAIIDDVTKSLAIGAKRTITPARGSVSRSRCGSGGRCCGEGGYRSTTR
jgi:hypothetical protein